MRNIYMRCRNKWSLVILGSVLCVVGMSIGGQHAHALSQFGPDPNDFSGGAAKFGYLTTTADNSDTNVTQTRVNIYFKNNTGTKTVMIPDGNLCTDDRGSAPGSGGNYRDVSGTNWANGDKATDYYVTAGAYTSSVSYGVFSSSNTCYSHIVNLSFPGSNLQFDANTGYYAATFVAQTHAGWNHGQNIFSLQLSDADGIIGYDSGLSVTSFGLAREYPSSGYRDYMLKFGPDCTVDKPEQATGYIYDDDNGDSAIQPQAMWNQMLKYKQDGTLVGPVPMTFTGYTSKQNGPDPDSYKIFSGSKKTVTMHFQVEPGFKYAWKWSHVYYVNLLQFRLPFNSIFYVTGCQAPSATVKPQSTVDKPQMSYPDTATFTHDINVGNFTSPADVKYSVQRYRNGAAVGGAQTGSYHLTAGGTFNVKTDQYSSTPADAGATICERMTLSNPPGGDLTIADPNPSEACTIVASEPYLKAYGGDVSAGNGLASSSGSCTQNPNAAIVSWNLEDATSNGAGTQYAAMALDKITDFATAQGNGGGAPPPSGLAFGNQSTSPGSGLFGGSFGSLPCIADYYGKKPTTTSPLGTNVSPLTTGAYSATGSVTLSGGTVNPNNRIQAYVDGDVYITNDITYAGSWSVDKMPLFELVVRGNIYIDKSVSQLDGVYIAQKKADGTAGTIYTCATSAAPLDPHDGGFYGTCKNKLTVNGTFTANQIQFLRTNNTVADSQSDTIGSSSAAEQFNFGPLLWVAQPQQTSGGGNASNYDAITSLPPIL